MKAAVVSHYGGPEVVSLAEVPEPGRPGPGQVLCEIMASTVNSADRRLRSADFPAGLGLLGRLAVGWSGPRRAVLGVELAGQVTEAGPGAPFAPGDRIIAFVGAGLGGHAERRLISAGEAAVAWPAELDLPTAAALSFGGSTALTFLRDLARVQPGQRVLVVGAAGVVGSAAVQVAGLLGAEVTALVGPSGVELARRLGAAEVIDRTQGDLWSSSRRFDLILDVPGVVRWGQAAPLLARGGQLAWVVATLTQMLATAIPWRGQGRRVRTATAPERREDLAWLAEHARAGRFRPVIDRVLPFTEVQAAHARAPGATGSTVLSWR